MARYLAILLSTLLGLNVVLSVTGGPLGGTSGIAICLGHADDHHAPAESKTDQAHAGCGDEQVHFHLADHADCCCSDLPVTVAEAPEFARTESDHPAPGAAESFPLTLPPSADAAFQRRPALPPPGEDPCGQIPRRLARTTQLRL